MPPLLAAAPATSAAREITRTWSGAHQRDGQSRMELAMKRAGMEKKSPDAQTVGRAMCAWAME